jgi:hypothetical protein
MPEQFAFQQILGDRAAVDRDEGLGRARPQVMQSGRQSFLPRPAFAQKHHRHVGRRQFLDVAADFQHGHAGGHDPLDRRTGRRGGQTAVLLLQPEEVQGTLHDRAKDFDINRLLAKIIGTEADGLQRVFAGPVAGGDDDLGLGREPQGFFQRRESLAHTIGVRRQAKVHDHDRRILPLNLSDRLSPRVREQHVAGRESPPVLRAQSFVVFDNQKFGFGHRPFHPTAPMAVAQPSSAPSVSPGVGHSVRRLPSGFQL